MEHSPSRASGGWSCGEQPRGSPLTLDTDAELAAGPVVSLVVGGVADHMLPFRELGAGLRAPQHHPDTTDGFFSISSTPGRPPALAGRACSTSALTS